MKFIIKKSHKVLALLLSFLSTFTLSIIGKQSAAEVKTGVTAKKTNNLSPSTSKTLSPVPPAFKPYVASDSTSPTPPAYTILQAADVVENPMEDDLSLFVNSNIQVPPADALESDELFQTNPALYRVMVEGMQMQILMLNQIEFLKAEVTDLKSQVEVLKSGAASTKVMQ